MNEQNIAVIPARGGSKRIPKKNIADLNGQPLISYSIKEALSSKNIEKVVVSTDDIEIAQISSQLGAEVIFPRPANLATDNALTIDVVRHTISVVEEKNAHIDAVVLLQPTSPFRTARQIDEAIDLFYRSQADTVTSVRPVKEHPYWQWELKCEEIVPLYSLEQMSMGRQELPKYYIENGAIYVTKRSIIMNYGFYGSKIIPYFMNDIESIDIDEPIDLMWAKYLLSNKFVKIGE